MTPRLMSNHFANDSLAHTEHAPKSVLRKMACEIQRTNGEHVMRLQFGVLMSLSAQWVAATLGFTVAIVSAFGASEQMGWVTARRVVAAMQRAQRRVERWMCQCIRETWSAPDLALQEKFAVAITKHRECP